MEKHIYISSNLTNDISSNYQIYEGKWFEQMESDANSNIIYKAIIFSIKYEPDSTFCHTSGEDGTCWCSQISDSSEDISVLFYHFRNFENLLELFKEKGYKFIE
jgi:hypothetical protein